MADVEVLVEDAGWEGLALAELAHAAANAVFERLRIDDAAEISLLATSDAAVARLNADFRGKPQPTNVLSWPASDLAPEAPGIAPSLPKADATGELFLGDIALAFETCAAEADAGGKPLSEHATHLIVHAILHLLGYDHTSDEDAVLMEGLETEILCQLDVADPYSGHAAEAGS
ncbi:MAG: rRNA maturation RNase YbeY [Pseudomonadota bacterium]